MSETPADCSDELLFRIAFAQKRGDVTPAVQNGVDFDETLEYPIKDLVTAFSPNNIGLSMSLLLWPAPGYFESHENVS